MVKDYLGNFFIIFITISITLISCDSKESNTANYLQPKVAGKNLIINGDFEEWHFNRLWKGWSTKSKYPKPQKIKDEEGYKVSLKGSTMGINYISQEVPLHPGDYYVAKINIYSYTGTYLNMGIQILEDDEIIGYHILPNNEYSNTQELSIKFKAASNSVVIRVGFTNKGEGLVIFDKASLHQTEKLVETFDHNYANYLMQELSLAPFDSLNYHSNILNISKYVNSILISPLRTYYSLTGKSEQEIYLENARIKRKSISEEINTLLPDSRFADYSNLDIKENSNGYCQQASLSCDNLLNQFNIPVRQLHMVNKENVGIHQFYQYWNPYIKKWIIVDPFYGINYVNNNQELIGYQQLLELLKANTLSTNNLNHVEIEKFYFNLEELRKGWNSQMKNILFSDMRKTYPH